MAYLNDWEALFERIHQALLARFAGVRGEEYVYYCIFHLDQNKPNLYVNKVKGVYHCWACGAKGSLLSLAERLGIKETPFLSPQEDAAREIANLIYNSAFFLTEEELRELCEERKLSSDTLLLSGVRRLKTLPQLPDSTDTNLSDFVGRFIFPIWGMQDELRTVVGYSPRSSKKYMYVSNAKLCPFGLNFLSKKQLSSPKEEKAPTNIFVVEGIFDALTAIEWKQQAVALLGANNTKFLRYLTFLDLTTNRLHLAADFDKAGRYALYQWARESVILRLHPSWVLYTESLSAAKDFNDIHRRLGKDIDSLIREGKVTKEVSAVFLLEETERRGEPLAPVVILLLFSLGLIDAIHILLSVKKELGDLACDIADKAAGRKLAALGAPSLLSFIEMGGADLAIMFTAATTTEGKRIILEYFYPHEVEGIFSVLPHIEYQKLPVGLTAKEVRTAVKRIAQVYRRLQPNSFLLLSDYILEHICPLLDEPPTTAP